jgi:lysophospholipase L1-like esterase
MRSPAPRHPGPAWYSAKGLLFRCGALALVLVPLALIEAGLQVFDCGRMTETEDPYIGFTAIHPLFERNAQTNRYEIARSRLDLFHPDSFAVQKDPREFRIFCLGGSTVQGSPYTIETSFTTWLELSLQVADPSRRWEVINCGGLSYASYRLVPILQEVLTYQADLIIVYVGQNEFLEDRSYAHVKATPRCLAWAHTWLARLRTYNLTRSAWMRLWAMRPGARGVAVRSSRTFMPAEVDAWLDNPGGLDAYHRDDAWRHAAIEHYQYNLQRMVDLARRARVPIVLCNPVTNLKDCPPFKIEARADLTSADRRRFEELWNRARTLKDSQATERIECLRQALAIDDRHAGAHFLLGHSLLSAGYVAEAKQAFVRAKDEDICPLRILEPMYPVLANVARTNGVPLVDVRALIESRTPDGIPGNEWLMDHVHPTISGHQLIAAALIAELERMGLVHPRPGWERTRESAYRNHLAHLETPYFVRAKERLDGQRKWTEGRARKQSRPAKKAGA